MPNRVVSPRRFGIHTEQKDTPLNSYTTQTWRDLRDQLTATQIQQLEAGARVQQPADLLDIAKDMAAQNLLQSALTDVPIPAGSTDVRLWHQDDDGAHRTVYGGRWTVGNADVVIVGEQDVTGATEWQIEVQHVENTVGDLTAEQTRELSRVLADAADTLEQLRDGNPWPVRLDLLPMLQRDRTARTGLLTAIHVSGLVRNNHRTDGHRDLTRWPFAVARIFARVGSGHDPGTAQEAGASDQSQVAGAVREVVQADLRLGKPAATQPASGG